MAYVKRTKQFLNIFCCEYYIMYMSINKCSADVKMKLQEILLKQLWQRHVSLQQLKKNSAVLTF